MVLFSLGLEGGETLKSCCVCRPPYGKVQYSKKWPWTHAKVQFLCLLKNENALHLPVLSIFLGNWEQENLLLTITHLIQYTVSEIQFWSVKYSTVTVGYPKISSKMSFVPIQATQTITMVRLDENKPLQNAFKRI